MNGVEVFNMVREKCYSPMEQLKRVTLNLMFSRELLKEDNPLVRQNHLEQVPIFMVCNPLAITNRLNFQE